jgi:hypothetical protein
MGEDRRTDITDGIQLRTYMVNGVSTLCSMDEAEWMCSEAPNTITAEQRMIQDMRQNLENYQVQSLPPRQIIGSETDCFRVTMTEDAAEYCFLGNIPLYASFGEGQNTVELMATSFSTTLTEEVFELPTATGGMNETGGVGGNETNGQMNQSESPIIPTPPADTVIVPENATIVPADEVPMNDTEENQTEENDSAFDVGY